jgi:hypothetical protein
VSVRRHTVVRDVTLPLVRWHHLPAREPVRVLLRPDGVSKRICEPSMHALNDLVQLSQSRDLDTPSRGADGNLEGEQRSLTKVEKAPHDRGRLHFGFASVGSHLPPCRHQDFMCEGHSKVIDRRLEQQRLGEVQHASSRGELAAVERFQGAVDASLIEVHERERLHEPGHALAEASHPALLHGLPRGG